MICPALVDYVRPEVEENAKLQKAVRLAREEREQLCLLDHAGLTALPGSGSESRVPRDTFSLLI